MVNRRHLIAVAVAIALGAICGAGAAAIWSGGRSSDPPTTPVTSAAVRQATTAATVAKTTTVRTTPVLITTSTTTTTVAPQTWLNTKALRSAVAAIQAEGVGQVGVAVRPLTGGMLFTAGNLLTGAAWSTIKVPIVMARYRLAAQQSPADRAAVGALASTAITESDNAAAAALFEQIAQVKGGVVGASRYVQSELALAGDPVTRVNTLESDPPWSTYGQTDWSVAAGTLFYRQLALGCVPPASATKTVIGLMRNITSSQRWGAGSVAWAPGVVAFKGGWGPDTSGRYLVRQFAIIQAPGGRGFVVGLISKPADSSFGTGTVVLSKLAAAVTAATRVSRSPVGQTCP